MAKQSTVKREYVTPDGTRLEIKPVSQYTLGMVLQKWERSKPLPPKITTYLNDNYDIPYEEYNEGDLEYLHLLSLWTADKNNDLNNTVIHLGVVTTPPDEFANTLAEILPDLGAKEVKTHWVLSLFGDKFDEGLGELSAAIIGQTMITEQGLEEVKPTFQSPNRRDRRAAVATQTRPESKALTHPKR